MAGYVMIKKSRYKWQLRREVPSRFLSFPLVGAEEARGVNAHFRHFIPISSSSPFLLFCTVCDIGSFSDLSLQSQGLDRMSCQRSNWQRIVACDFELCRTSIINESDSFFELLNYTSAPELNCSTHLGRFLFSLSLHTIATG